MNLDNNLNNNSNTNLDSTIHMRELLYNVSNIIKSSDKNDFIKNYNEYHTKIKHVDEILYKANTIDINTDINILFEMLKEFDILLTSDDFTVEEYKNMVNLVEVIETKIKSSNFDIKEV